MEERRAKTRPQPINRHPPVVKFNEDSDYTYFSENSCREGSSGF